MLVEPDGDSRGSGGGGGEGHHGATTTAAAATQPAALYAFLCNNLQPGSSHLLLPFLRLPDLLRLSKCCKDLMDYRLLLRKVTIAPQPSATPATRMGLARLLMAQRGLASGVNEGGLECLRLSSRDCLFVLGLASLGAFQHLTTLDLDGMVDAEGEDLRVVADALAGGNLQRLEELLLFSFDDHDQHLTRCGFEQLTGALAQGACPRLRVLNINAVTLEHHDGSGLAVARVLSSRRCPHLELLDLGCHKLGSGLVSIARALGSGCCPRLKVLDMQACDGMSSQGLQELGEALRSGACPDLEVLGLSRDKGGSGTALVPLFDALAAGQCPKLRSFILGSTTLSMAEGRALGRALASGSCTGLQNLDLEYGILSDDGEGAMAVVEAIKGGGCPILRDLQLESCGMESEHGRVLAQAMEAGKCSHLVTLVVSLNDIGDEGMVPLLLALSKGACPDLDLLYLEGVELGPPGERALARALRSGHLSKLTALAVSYNPDVGDKAICRVLTAVQEGCCPRLKVREVSVIGTGMSEASKTKFGVMRDPFAS